jgi:Flp pilus assembly protein TadG
MRGQLTHRQARGAAAIEFALVLPLLLALVLGAIDWGYYFFVEQVVVNAAREGARVGTLQSNATQADALNNAQSACTSFITQAGLNSAGATCTPSTGAGPSIVVTASYPTGSLTGFMNAIVPAQAFARAEMRN